MSHITIHHVVSVDVRSTDTQLLDDVAATLPESDAPYVGGEYDGPARGTPDTDATLSDGEERLTARVAFVNGTVAGDGASYDGVEEASTLFDTLAALGLSNAAAYTLRHYKTPMGAVSSGEVQAFYEENPDLQPVDGDGEAYVPTSFRPEHHVVAEESGN